MATQADEIRQLRGNPQGQRLVQTFREQVRVRGRAHHRALLKEMRGGAPDPATEPMQEFALTVKGKLRLFAPKTRRKGTVPLSGTVPFRTTGRDSPPTTGTVPTETFAYLPGCLTTESAREYDASIRLVARAVGIALEEIDDWNCCGAGIVQDVDPASGAELARRNVARLSRSLGASAGAGLSPSLGASRTITSGCPICIARTRDAAPEASATHLLGILTRPDVLAKLTEKIKSTGEKRPVGSLKVAVLYGCELSNRALWALPSPLGGEKGDCPVVRDCPLSNGGAGQSPGTPSPRPSPSGGEGVVSPIETLMEAAGATVMKWGGLKRCCGGYLLYARPDLGFEMLEKVFRDFEKSDADAIVTACPHCHFNLDAFQFAIGRARKRALEVPVLHFTEVLALAMNLDLERELERHVTSLLPLLERLVTGEDKRKTAERRRKPEARNPKPD